MKGNNILSVLDNKNVIEQLGNESCIYVPNMSVGINFENSCLKTSFSLSSLPASEYTPDKSVKHRLYNSLTKNRVKATAVRRSWGSTASEHREEFWSVLQANYNYIMDNQLIDNCQEVDGDLSRQMNTWTLKELYSKFSELYSWLNSVQETIYGKEENIADKVLRAHCVNMILEKSTSLKLFNEQASQLVQLYPEVQEEVSWRATHLNSKWDSILSILGPSDCDHCDPTSCLDIDHELKCLRQWFKVMESRIQPLDFRAKYTKTEIETKALELNVLHRDIENHGKIVGSVVKLCKKTEAKCNTVNARRIANGLERRWHLLFLRSLEWQCYLESLSKKQTLGSPATSSDNSDSDCYKEPASKYPRLNEKQRTRTSNCPQFGDCFPNEEDCNELIFENGMSDKAYRELEKENEIDEVDSCITSIEDTSDFTRTNKKAPNLATYYFRHEDTDSDMDRIEQQCITSKTDGQSTLEETSEEEWTYTKNIDKRIDKKYQQRAEIDEIYVTPKPKVIPDDTIKRLVQKAEELVSPDKSRKKSLNKFSRVNKWLSIEKIDDSCDASGEDDERESQTSEDFETSTTTLREAHTSFDELNSTNENNQWCRPCMSLSEFRDNTLINFSISESALHKMNFSAKILDKFSTISNNNFNINSNNSTSSTVEEVSPLVVEKTSAIKKKKSKLKKKILFGKSDTHLLINTVPHKNRNLIKSGSFSGYSTRDTNNDKFDSSYSSSRKMCTHGVFSETATSGAESEEEFNRRISGYKFGIRMRHSHPLDIRDISPDKSSLNTAEEQSSSLSEQAWDNYQENYLSEAYSESHDSDAARKLLNFGEDYRNFIDSQSDWSAFSDMSPTFRRKKWISQNVGDSNSEDEALKQLIKDSKNQLVYAEEIYKEVKVGIDKHLITNEIDNLVSTCDRYIALMSHMNESSAEYRMSVGDKAVTTGLLSQWRILKTRSIKMQDFQRIQKQIEELKIFVTSATKPDMKRLLVINFPAEDIHNEIDSCNKLLEAITNQSINLASVNAVVHRFTLENQDSEEFGNCCFKTDISELYELFDKARTSTTDKLCQMESLVPAWTTLESRLEQLQKDLREDQKKIYLLDTCLASGSFTYKTANSVRDVAKLLSETTVHQGYHPLQEIFTEGSFSDSGISDEGSEHEIGERQGRLAAIRRLVRQLEVGLSPDSQARQIMREKLNTAEEELKSLQMKCRSLIVRTATCSATSSDLSQHQNDGSLTASTKDKPDDDEPGNDPQTQSLFKRIFKASVAFQIVLLTFICLSCLYEPQCCDYMNNYSWSLSPKLRYQGRPPI